MLRSTLSRGLLDAGPSWDARVRPADASSSSGRLNFWSAAARNSGESRSVRIVSRMSPPVAVKVRATAATTEGGGGDVEHSFAMVAPEARRQRVAEHGLGAVVVIRGAEVELAGPPPLAAAD